MRDRTSPRKTVSSVGPDTHTSTRCIILDHCLLLNFGSCIGDPGTHALVGDIQRRGGAGAIANRQGWLVTVSQRR
jgi:hypothetical protein